MKKQDLTGQKFNRLTALKETGKIKHGGVEWLFLCECGNEIETKGTYAKTGHTKSCGCLHAEMTSIAKTIHGQTHTPEYGAWTQMKDRCYNPKNNRSKTYSLRGITVCDRWLGENGFINFFADMGKRPSKGHSLDRYPNNDGNYEPTNCRWGTDEQQSKNTTRSKKFEYDGRVMIQADWARELNLHPSYIRYHLGKGRDFKWIYEYFVQINGRQRKA